MQATVRLLYGYCTATVQPAADSISTTMQQQFYQIYLSKAVEVARPSWDIREPFTRQLDVSNGPCLVKSSTDNHTSRIVTGTPESNLE